MIIHDCIQGSPEWYQVKAGIPSSSDFDKILTMTGQKSTQVDGYSDKLVAEIMLGRPVVTFEKTPWMLRGSEMEAEAVRAYEFQKDVEALPVGFITNDEGTLGCSPDRLIGKGGLEIKCPSEHIHVKYLLNPEKLIKEYHVQNQGQYYVAELEFVDLMSYSPELPPVIIRVPIQCDYQDLLGSALKDFLVTLESKKNRMRELGYLKDAAI